MVTLHQPSHLYIGGITYKLTRVLAYLLALTLVIDSAPIWWDIFSHMMMLYMAILSIPLSSQLPKDRLVWAYTWPKGNFTVRSSYKVVNVMSLSSTPFLGEPSNCQNQGLFWKIHRKAPNKIKSFAWRASKYIFPTKDNLCHRKIIDDACGIVAESSGHMF